MSISSCELVKILENDRQIETGKNIWKGAYGYSSYTTIATAVKVTDLCKKTEPVSHVGAKQVYNEKAFDLDPNQRQIKQQVEISEQDAKALLDQARIRCEQDLEKIEMSIR